MALRVSGKNFDIGESLRQHVVERIDALSGKYFNGSVSGHVIVDHEGSGYRTDCTLHLDSGTILHVDGFAHESYASFEQSASRLEKRLRRYKGRLKGHHGSADASPKHAGVIQDYTIAAPDHDEPEGVDFHPIVIAEKARALKTLSVAGAVSELDLTGRTILAFRHSTSERVNFVYRRNDGNIGWLDPDGTGEAKDAGQKNR